MPANAMDDHTPVGRAPADAVARQAWPVWKKIVAYLALAALASIAIWVIDLKVVPQAAPKVVGTPVGR